MAFPVSVALPDWLTIPAWLMTPVVAGMLWGSTALAVQVPESEPVAPQERSLEEKLATANERIDSLETRLAQLESLLFSTAQLSVYEAERRVIRARRELEQNERLFYQGLLLSIELDRSRYEYDRARQELELAQATDGHRRLAAQIDLADARFRVRWAEDQLQRNETALARGLITKHQLRRSREEAESAAAALEVAKQRLEVIAGTQTDAENNSGSDGTKPEASPAAQPDGGDETNPPDEDNKDNDDGDSSRRSRR